MRIETPPETISFEALLFGVMVGAIATAAMASLGDIAFLNALLGGAILAIVVWFVVTRMGKDLPPPRGPGNLDVKAPEYTPVVPAPKRQMPSPVVVKSAPAAAETSAPAATPGAKPATMTAARDGSPDDLKQIKGVGPKLEELLNSMGFYHYDQIAAWTPEEVAWVDENLEGFKGRVSRDDWVGQAKSLTLAAD